MLLDCQAAVDVLRQRVRARLARRDDASEADERVLEFQLTVDEPLTAQEQACAIVVRTDGPVDVVALAARWLAAQDRT